MRTVVYQSYRTTGVPAWLARCLASVQAWAARRGFQYRFLGDELFERAPKLASKVAMTDVARLVVAQELLVDHDRAVWIDADVVVLDPAWELPEGDFYLCHELWPVAEGFEARVNNAVSIYSRDNVFLPFYLDACKVVIAAGEPHKLALGTELLTRWHRVAPLPLLDNIGMFGPAILRDLAHGTDAILSAYLRAMAVPLVAANCCASLDLSDAVYAAAIANYSSRR